MTVFGTAPQEDERQPRQHAPTVEYLVGGRRPRLGGHYGQVLDSVFRATQDDPRMADYEAMLIDGDCKSSLQLLIGLALQDGIQFLPAVEDAQVDEDSEAGFSPSEADDAWEAARFCERAVMDLDDPLEETVRQVAFDGMAFRGGLAEKVYVESTGRDIGSLYLDRINPKHRDDWELVSDRNGNINGVRPTGWARRNRASKIDIAKFLYMAWDRRSGSIFGTSVLDAAWPYWNFKAQLPSLWWDFLALFALPNYHATVGPEAEPRRPIDPETGQEVEGAPTVHPVVAAFQELQKVLSMGGRLIVGEHGSEVSILEPGGQGESFKAACDYFDRKMVQSILWSARATSESEFGSKADSEGALDVVDVASMGVKSWVAARVRRAVLRDLMAVNFGEEKARRFTPLVTLGRVNRRDFSRFGNTVTKMFQAGMILPEERLDALAFTGVRVRGARGTGRVPERRNPSVAVPATPGP